MFFLLFKQFTECYHWFSGLKNEAKGYKYLIFSAIGVWLGDIFFKGREEFSESESYIKSSVYYLIF